MMRRQALWPLSANPALRGWLLFLRFLVVGLLNTAFGYAVFGSLVLLGAWPGAAVVGSSLAGVAFNFQTSRRLVFRSRGRAWRFIGLYCVVLILNWLALRVLLGAGMSDLLGQAMLTVPLAVISFVGQRVFVFSAV